MGNKNNNEWMCSRTQSNINLGSGMMVLMVLMALLGWEDEGLKLWCG